MVQDNVYQYDKPGRPARPLRLNRLPRLSAAPDSPPLTGLVQEKSATDIEERVARALYKLQVPFRFQVVVPVLGSLPGRGKVIDFLLGTRVYQPLEVDGPLWHTHAAEKGEDDLRELLLNAEFRKRGWLPLRRLGWLQLDSQDATDRSLRQLLAGITVFGWQPQERRER
jgi:hypothetical protein